MKQLTLVILDDEKTIHDGMTDFLQEQSFTVFNTFKPSELFTILDKHDIDILILDLKLPEMNGIEVLKKVKEEHAGIEVIMITGHGDAESIIEAMKYGAFDYFYKPISLIEIKNSIERTTRFVSLQNDLVNLKDAYSKLTDQLVMQIGGKIIGESKVIGDVWKMIEKAAGSDKTPVLIQGPSGCGKELVARTIHFMSDRKDQLLVPVNCAAIPENLIESEFFGHVKGAFTGATENKAGCFEIADNGTLFIDEIGDMPLAAQTKLLRVLETMQIKRVGDTKEQLVNTRIITATHQNIKAMVDKGTFRLDLYYRLNTLEIEVPSLKQRIEDIPQLLEYYICYFSESMGKGVKGIKKEVVDILSRYDFPGNIRELRNMVERAVILCTDCEWLTLQHFPIREIIDSYKNDVDQVTGDSTTKRVQTGTGENYNLDHIEKETIVTVLQLAENNITLASEMLGLSRPALYRKMEKHNLQ